MCAQCDFSKYSGTFCFGNTHPLIVTLYLLWRSRKVLKKKESERERERETERDRQIERERERERD